MKTEVKVTEKKPKVKNLAFVYYFGCIFAPKKCSQFNAWYVERDRGREPREHGAEGVRETEEERQERAGSGIPTRAGSRREIQKGKRLSFDCL